MADATQLNLHSLDTGGNLVPTSFTEESVSSVIRALYSKPSSIAEANAYLTEFQQHTSAWSICISILNRNASIIASDVEKNKQSPPDPLSADSSSLLSSSWIPVSPTTEILFFASQTLCTQAQAGFPQQLAITNCPPAATFREIRNGLFNLVYNFRFGPKQVLKQLCIATCSCCMFAHEEMEFRNESAINHILTVFGQTVGEEGYELLIEVLTTLAEELFNKRVAVGWKLREDFIQSCLKGVPSLWQTIATIYKQIGAKREKYSRECQQQESAFDSPSTTQTFSLPSSALMRHVIKCFSAWIMAYLLYSRHLAEVDPQFLQQDPNLFNDVFNALKDQELYIISLRNVASAETEIIQICSEAHMNILGLSRSKSEEAFEVIRYMIYAYSEVFEMLLGPIEVGDVDIGTLNGTLLLALTHPLVEMAKEHFCNIFYSDKEMHKKMTNLAWRLADLLRHPSISVREQILDFWYNLLSHQLMSPSMTSSELSKAGKEDDLTSSGLSMPLKDEEEQKEMLKPLFQRLVEVLLETVAFPIDMETREDFDYVTFQKYRDECSINLTESTVVVGHEYILSLAGNAFLQIVKDWNISGSNPVVWSRVEACLFVLTTVAPRAPAGGDSFIPTALAALPQLPYASMGVMAYIMRRAASCLIFWTAGYIGTQRDLFASLFQLVACQFATFVVQNKKSLEDPYETERSHCEKAIVHTLNALTASAGLMLIKEGASEDIMIVLNALTTLIVTVGMSTENKASLVVAAGSILSYLPKEKMQELHLQLVKKWLKCEMLLFSKIRRDDGYGVSSPEVYMEKSEQPLGENLQASFNEISSSADSEFRHPVLDVVETQWPLIEEIILRGGKVEMFAEQILNAFVGIFSTCRSHVPRYSLFYSFLDLVGRTFVSNPTVFHLAAVRTIIGMFAYVPMDTVLTALIGSLQMFFEFILGKMQSLGEAYTFEQPDLIGMTIDCANVALMHCLLAHRIVRKEWFVSLIQAAIQFAPNCLHPKVLHTYMVYLSRLVAWVSPPPSLYSFVSGYNATWLQSAASETKKFVCELMEKAYNDSSMTYMHGIINAVIKAVANIHTAAQSWIGSAAQVLLPLLNHPRLGPKALELLRLVILDIHPNYMSTEHRELFYRNCTTEKQPRQFADMLMRTVEETKAEYQRSLFQKRAAV
ncbi:hypothetical protein IE077_002792 [Cardiosporidium cionae]|uniref:Uncharacterized protein n=1 Tax=Cardiosporidium cionae TaxID=476202 RepID=A0ABQ7JFK3_9APIC|nr:hypothetical protein IE077_002792 [Cardiosporidium cionae]|eukprot:KAF8822746.1 hypothetical protein IE077_002792 [Cardiosporidium cionae]